MATHTLTTSNSSGLKELEQKLINCALTCEDCEQACLNEEDITLLSRCIELDRDCSDICFQAARLLKRQSEIGDEYLSLVEKMCTLCAEECRKHDHEHCQHCAEVCEACAEACRAV